MTEKKTSKRKNESKNLLQEIINGDRWTKWLSSHVPPWYQTDPDQCHWKTIALIFSFFFSFTFGISLFPPVKSFYFFYLSLKLCFMVFYIFFSTGISLKHFSLFPWLDLPPFQTENEQIAYNILRSASGELDKRNVLTLWICGFVAFSVRLKSVFDYKTSEWLESPVRSALVHPKWKLKIKFGIESSWRRKNGERNALSPLRA